MFTAARPDDDQIYVILDYVPGHIIEVLFPAWLCGQQQSRAALMLVDALAGVGHGYIIFVG